MAGCPECESFAFEMASGNGRSLSRCLTCGAFWEEREGYPVWVIRHGRLYVHRADETAPVITPSTEEPSDHVTAATARGVESMGGDLLEQQ
jgi:hypothetical protein